jgi:hypothetical protein
MCSAHPLALCAPQLSCVERFKPIDIVDRLRLLIPLEIAQVYCLRRPRAFHESDLDLAPGAATGLLARTGRRGRGRDRTAAKWRRDRCARDPHARASLSRCAIPPGSTLTRAGLGGGVPGGARYTSPFGLAVRQKPRRDALCLSAAPAPHQAGPPSRRPIRPKRAAISRLLAQNLKRDLARRENREIAGVLERGAGLPSSSDCFSQPKDSAQKWARRTRELQGQKYSLDQAIKAANEVFPSKFVPTNIRSTRLKACFATSRNSNDLNRDLKPELHALWSGQNGDRM